MNLFELTKSLINIPSISENEEQIGFFLRDYLENLGWTVELQAVSANQNNVIAYLNSTPRVFLSTHIDTVPPFIEASEDAEKIYGRGACDAKGIVASQIFAAENLRKQGINDIGLLYTVDEEQGSSGARMANKHPIAAKCAMTLVFKPPLIKPILLVVSPKNSSFGKLIWRMSAKISNNFSIADSPRSGYAECAAVPFVLIRKRSEPFEPTAKSLSVGSPFIRYSHFAAIGCLFAILAPELPCSSSTV